MNLPQDAGEGAIGNPSGSSSMVMLPWPVPALVPAPADTVDIYFATVRIMSEAFSSCISRNDLQGISKSCEMFS